MKGGRLKRERTPARAGWTDGNGSFGSGHFDGTEGAGRHGRIVGSEPAGGRVAHGLGWFSLGLGVAQLAAPGALARLIGLPADARTKVIMRLIGLRELTHGLGILSRSRPVGWVRTRVAGDLLDLTLLGTAMRTRNGRRGRIATAATAVVGVAALDVFCGQELADSTEAGTESTDAIEIARSITVNRPVEEVFGFWRNFSNLPRFMLHLEEVHDTANGHSEWRVRAPGGVRIGWEAELTADRPNEMIGWRSLPGSQVQHEGVVRFRHAPGGRGTEIHVVLRYVPPAGTVGVAIAKLLGKEPGQQVRDDLRAFKQMIETGEIARSEGGIRGPRQQKQRPAQPREYAPAHV